MRARETPFPLYPSFVPRKKKSGLQREAMRAAKLFSFRVARVNALAYASLFTSYA